MTAAILAELAIPIWRQRGSNSCQLRIHPALEQHPQLLAELQQALAYLNLDYHMGASSTAALQFSVGKQSFELSLSDLNNPEAKRQFWEHLNSFLN